MNYQYVYLAAGVIVFLVNFNFSDSAKLSIREIAASVKSSIRQRDTLLELLLGVVIMTIATIIFVIAWPVLGPYVLYNTYIAHRNEVARKKAEQFLLGRENLLQRMSISEIEIMERIIDPLRAVPDLPFGHLNQAWGKFKAKTQPDDQIWSFMATWNRPWASRECRGYALLRGNNVAHHFITGWENIEQPPSTIQEGSSAASNLLSKVAD